MFIEFKVNSIFGEDHPIIKVPYDHVINAAIREKSKKSWKNQLLQWDYQLLVESLE